MHVGSADNICSGDEARKYAEQIPTLANFVSIEGAGHGIFASYSGSDYVQLLFNELEVFGPEESSFITTTLEGF